MATKKKMLQAAAGQAGGEDSGTILLHLDGKTDISGNSVTVLDYNNDVTTSTSIVPFAGATAADFRSSTSSTTTLRVDSGLMADHDAGDPWCVEFWYYLTSNPSVDSPFAFNSQSGGNDMTVLFGHNNGMASIGTVTMDLATVNVGTGYLALSTWRHFCLSSDGTTVRFWIDGSVVDTFTPTQFGFKNSYLLIGNEADGIPVHGSGNLFPGLIADFRVWNIEAYPVTSGSFTPATSLTSHPYQNGGSGGGGSSSTSPRTTSLVHGLQSYNIASPTSYGTSYGGSYSTKFNDNGTRFWNVSAHPSNGSVLPSVYQYELATAYDPTSYTSVVTYTTNWSASYPVTSIDFSRDGAYMFAFSYGTSRVYRIPLASAFDITSAPVSDQNAYFAHGGGGAAGAGWILSDGSAFITTQRTTDAWIWPLSTAYDLNTATSSPTRVDLSSYMTHTPYGGTFFTDSAGDHFWMVGTRSNNYVYSFQLGTSEDLTTIQSVTSRDFGVNSYDAQITSNDLLFLGTGNSAAGDFYKFVR